jgi:hypothetical protein
MQIEQSTLPHRERNGKDTYIFTRKDRSWYITLFFHNGTASIEREFELVEGTDKLLDTIAHGRNKMRLYFSVEPLGGSELLELLECCAPPESGGIYKLKTGSKYNGTKFWICDLALIVFADIPERIYIKRLPLPDQRARENEHRFV